MDDPSHDLISVYQAANSAEAHLVKNVLADAGIRAQVSEDHEPFASLPITAPDVLVLRSDEARAREIITQYGDEQMRRAERPDWICAGCGAEVIGAFDECDACGAARPGGYEDG